MPCLRDFSEARGILPPQLRLGNKLIISKLPSLSFPSGTKSGNYETIVTLGASANNVKKCALTAKKL